MFIKAIRKGIREIFLANKQKGMTFDHDFCYSFSFVLSSFFRREEKRGKDKLKSWISDRSFIATCILRLFMVAIDKSNIEQKQREKVICIQNLLLPIIIE